MNAKTKQQAVRNLLVLEEQMKEAQRAVTAQLEVIAQSMAPGESVEVDGETYELVDNFANKNTVFRPACVHRFEIVEMA